jgi:hypothetical protein
MATSRVGAFTSLPTGVMTGFITSTCHQIKIIPEKDGAVLFLFRLVHDAAAAASLLFNGKEMLLTGGAKDVEKKSVASAGNRTRAARVAGEHSTTEPPMLLFFCLHLA